MADQHDDHKAPEMPAVDAARLKGATPQQPSGTGNAEIGGAATGAVKRGGR